MSLESLAKLSDIKNKNLDILTDRAYMLSKARYFFSERNILEVDCPILSPSASVDAHIDLISVDTGSERRYLHSSPEYGMKRLLSQGIGDIYQLSHVFRKGENSHRHNPEFMMAEWYRLGLGFHDMIAETLEFIELFLGEQPKQILTYREAFLTFTGLDYVTSTPSQLLAYLQSHEIIVNPLDFDSKDDLLNLILGNIIEPKLGKNCLCVLAYYPGTQAALARTKMHADELVGERFEIYYQGIELANGYHELGDVVEQRARFEEANNLRLALGKETLPIDEKFLEALARGLPDCCGVAVGFDRLMMLRHNKPNIGDVIPFSWLQT